MKNKFMIIDGNSILFRAFYAMPPLKTKKGQYTNAVYGFLNMLYKLIDDYSPEYICVAFDPKKPTFRHIQYTEYKAGRAKTPDELVQQFGLIRSVLNTHNIKCIEIEGFEADDAAGTLAKHSKENGMSVFLVTSDKDYLQLVDDDVKVLLTKKGVSNIKEMNRAQINEDYEIEPEEFVDLKALMGDKSDNIPGVGGVGEKTAIKLIKEYHNLDSLYEHIEEIKGKLKEKLENDKMQAYMSKTLSKIVTDIPVEIDLNEYKLQEADGQKLLKLYDDLEFKNFKKRIKNVSIDNSNAISVEDTQMSIFNLEPTNTKQNIKTKDLIIIENINDDKFVKLKEEIAETKKISLKFLLNGERSLFSNAIALGISPCNENIYYIAIDKQNQESILEGLKDILLDESIKKIGHNLKSDIIYLEKNNIELKGINFDAQVAAYLIDPAENSYSIDKLSSKFLDLEIPVLSDYIGSGKSKLSFEDIDIEKKKKYIFNYIRSIVYLEQNIIDKIETLNMSSLFYNIEMPLVEVLANMEFTGFKIDTHILDELGSKFNKKLEILESVIYEMAGERFNINSPKQLGVILFEKLNLEVVKKTKTGYSTDIEVLDKLKDKHPIIEKIIEYRQLTKLNSTYVEGLMAVVDKKTHRVHSILNQTITTTGRISSTDPNLQNIPTRTDDGKEIRKAFIAEDGYTLVDADYSQIELRVLAELSNEEKLVDAFKQNEDIHSKTASEVFKVCIEDVTSTMRSRAKAVNFGIIYGISDYGLSRDLNIPRKEAKEYIENYLGYYSNIDAYMRNTVEQSKKDLYVETYFGRRRNIPELSSRNFHIRSFGERIALNTPVQGTAADIIKIAMVNVYKKLRDSNLKSKLLLQVHDELIIEAATNEVEIVVDMLKHEMENVVTDFKVKLEVDINVGDNWYESK
ncbi:DNA polymerase I [Sedimentibacter sp. zth1]|uniref:DNA polymerase I n=1 Tax=Sedimentibacter sp. zth1 TaxID=2816908 RepID=UPI001A92313F|nr:DNA polymerase I [Sedimentibacter sp. zth1]QSX07025.1 DNA polymerase I [Sedimentibacter sp. zth1]